MRIAGTKINRLAGLFVASGPKAGAFGGAFKTALESWSPIERGAPGGGVALTVVLIDLDDEALGRLASGLLRLNVQRLESIENVGKPVHMLVTRIQDDFYAVPSPDREKPRSDVEYVLRGQRARRQVAESLYDARDRMSRTRDFLGYPVGA